MTRRTFNKENAEQVLQDFQRLRRFREEAQSAGLVIETVTGSRQEGSR